MNSRRPSSRRSLWPHYMYGFGNEFSSEALPGALPQHNNPQRCPYSLYAEQITGSPSSTSSSCIKVKRTWMYRIRPSAVQGTVVPDPQLARLLAEPDHVTPERLRWSPIPVTNPLEAPHNFIEGLITIAGAGDPADKNGLAMYTYTCNKSMINTCFSSSDGDMLIVAEMGTLRFQTELGDLVVYPGHIIVIPRGIRFAVKFIDQDSPNTVIYDGAARGYILEIYNGSFELPDLSNLLGNNTLANARDFRYPTASFNDNETEYLSVTKFQGGIFKCRLINCPFDVVAWHGNYAPFAYDLSLFCPINNALFDYSDHSMFTVLTCPSLIDFIIFPPKWLTQEDTLRLPYFHKNSMSQFMGIIFDDEISTNKDNIKFGPGTCILHSTMAPHGPDAMTFHKAITNPHANLPKRCPSNNLSFMFQCNKMLKLTDFAMTTEYRDVGYSSSWHGLEKMFNRNRA